MSVFDSLEFRHLKYIVATAEGGSFSAAAASLHVAQSAISRQIREIEDIFQIRIFDRKHEGAKLTPTGEQFLVYARKLLAEREEVIRAIQAVHQDSLRPFQLGFTSFVEHDVLVTVCDAYKEMFVNGEIMPEGGDTEDLINHVCEEEIDAALVTLPVDDECVAVQPIMRERLVVCIRKDDPLAEHKEIPSDQLNGRLSIFSDPRHHPRAHIRLLEMLEDQGISPRSAKPTFNSDHVQWMVRENLCLALIREHQPISDDLVTRPIQGVHWTLDSAIIYKPDHKLVALPLFLRELANRFPVATLSPTKKPPTSITEQHLLSFSDEDEEQTG